MPTTKVLRRQLDPLDQAIRRPGHGAQWWPHVLDGLVMHRVDLDMRLARRTRQQAAGFDVESVHEQVFYDA